MNTSIQQYDNLVLKTDRLPPDNISPVLQGLFGEVGSAMATAKKLHREKDSYVTYKEDVVEEFGDVFWYLAALCRRQKISLANLIDIAAHGEKIQSKVVVGSSATAPVVELHSFDELGSLDELLLQLGQSAAVLLNSSAPKNEIEENISNFVTVYLKSVQASGIPFSSIVENNMSKVSGIFLKPDFKKLDTFDEGFPEEERLPDKFEIEINERGNGRSYLRWKGVFVGDPLTDNIADEDGYKFHDVFHFANAAILHWSPTFRALIRHKRKSNPKVDESQDSGRAIVIEEGLSAYIFSRAKLLGFFENQSSVPLDLLNTIKDFVRGYEVESCPLYLWQTAILEGYDVFRKVRDNRGGIIVGDRKKRTLKYKKLK